MLKNDRWIREQGAAMISPFYGSSVSQLVVTTEAKQMALFNRLSYGTSSYGYDLTLAEYDFRVFKHKPGHIMDPKKFDPDFLEFLELEHDLAEPANDIGSQDMSLYPLDSFFVLPSRSYALGYTKERLRIPPNITGITLGKSTYARLGILINTTPAEAGWEGHLTLEIGNVSDADCRIYANEGIAQMLFFEGEPCDTTYADRKGKYQNQPAGVVTARMASS